MKFLGNNLLEIAVCFSLLCALGVSAGVGNLEAAKYGRLVEDVHGKSDEVKQASVGFSF